MKKIYSAPTATLFLFQAEGMLAISGFKTVDDESNFGASGGLSNKQQPSNSIWKNMSTDE